MKKLLIKNIGKLYSLQGVKKKKGKRIVESDLSMIENSYVLINCENNEILQMGSSQNPNLKGYRGKSYDAKGGIILPSYTDAHTHPVFVGSRHHEFKLRLEGKSYEEINAQGGGINSSVKQLRDANFETLKRCTEENLDEIKKWGVTNFEVKSGYGLNLESELKSLKVIQTLQKKKKYHLFPTLMAAHAIPEERKQNREKYIDEICNEILPQVSKQRLAEYCDIFVERGFFSAEEGRKISLVAKTLGLKIRLHIDQISDQGGVELALELKPDSVDHLEQTSLEKLEKLAMTDITSIFLPTASLFLRSPYPRMREFLDFGGRGAISTDFNPGTSPCTNLVLAATIAILQMKIQPFEALAAITFNPAYSLGRIDLGVIEKGSKPGLLHYNIPSVEYLFYRFGQILPERIFFNPY